MVTGNTAPTPGHSFPIHVSPIATFDGLDAQNTRRNIRILANERHEHIPGGHLLPLIQCFPNLETLSISWLLLYRRPNPAWGEYYLKSNLGPVDGLPPVRRLQILLHQEDSEGNGRTFDKTILEVLSLMKHLPLIHVKDLSLFFESFVNFDTMDIGDFLRCLLWTCEAMQFPQLESFHLASNYDVFGLPFLDLWVRLGLHKPGCSSLTR
jgi:hypothetical protein